MKTYSSAPKLPIFGISPVLKDPFRLLDPWRFRHGSKTKSRQVLRLWAHYDGRSLNRPTGYYLHLIAASQRGIVR